MKPNKYTRQKFHYRFFSYSEDAQHKTKILLSVSYNDENENITNNVLWFNSSNERDMITRFLPF